MHIGLIVGIGPAATDYYYRYLISAVARAGRDLALTMAHADTRTLLRNQSERNVDAQVDIYSQLTSRLQRSGAERIAVTSIAGHFCIDAFKKISPVPVIDLLDVVRIEVKRRGFRRIGLLGTRLVMETHFYGVLDGVEVIEVEDSEMMEEFEDTNMVDSEFASVPPDQLMLVRRELFEIRDLLSTTH